MGREWLSETNKYHTIKNFVERYHPKMGKFMSKGTFNSIRREVER